MAADNAKVFPMTEFDTKIYIHVKGEIDRAIAHRQEIKFDEKIDNNEKRYIAMRSTSGLKWGDLPKKKPWPGCSDIGIPIDAITIQGLVARCDRVEFEQLPLTHITGVGPQDRKSAPKIEAYLDWQKLNKMKIRIPKMMATRRAAIDGSYFLKPVWEEYRKKNN